MVSRWWVASATALMLAAAGMADGQENMISPPAPLPWPAAELDSSLQTSFAISMLRREIEIKTNIERPNLVYTMLFERPAAVRAPERDPAGVRLRPAGGSSRRHA
jgi:hypothetical protein